MGHKNKSDKKKSGSSRNRISIIGTARNNPDQAGTEHYREDRYEEDRANDDADSMLRRAIDQKRGMFKKPPRPVYDSWNLPEEAAIKPSPTHAGKGPRGYKRSDERIHEDVCEALYAHPEIDASEMEVQVKDGVVTFTGYVESRLVKRMAEDLIENIPGVNDVRNELYFSNGSKMVQNGKRKYQDQR